MKITPEEVLRIATLAHLELSPEDTARYARDLEEILQYVTQLNELDTSGVEPMVQVLHDGGQPSLRPDAPGPSLRQSTALQSAPLKGAGHFKVPRVIER